MKKTKPVLFFLFFIAACFSAAQAQKVDSLRFFTDEKLIEMTLTTDIRGLQAQKGDDVFQDGTITMRFPDSTVITENIEVGARGKFRRDYCRIPPMMINFRQSTPSRFASLGKLKLVIGCGVKADDEQLLLKEFIIYKIYNLLEEKSFRVRLVKTNYIDSKNKIKPFTQYSFFIEDDADMARRNNCKKKEGVFLTESTNRDMMTMVSIFEYMIGNTDWSVPNNHNVKLIVDRKAVNTLPYVVPYDFDYCGLVDASYAIPNEVIGTEKVTERVFRGFPRSMDEIQVVLDEFRNKKAAIFSLINNFSLISERNRGIMIDYLEDFYKTISSQNMVKTVFIDNARVN
ncbi:MAG: hypothetical protein ABL876_06035 [Chitinophagaceae bacterium]